MSGNYERVRTNPSHEEGIRAAEVICMVIRGEIIKSAHSLSIIEDAVKTIYAYNGKQMPREATRIDLDGPRRKGFAA